MSPLHPEIRAYLDLLTTQCKEHYGEALRSLVLYGSVARGTFRPTSDLDLPVLLHRFTLNWKKRNGDQNKRSVICGRSLLHEAHRPEARPSEKLV